MIKSEVKSRKFCETNDYITMEYLLKREGTRLNDSHIPIIRRLITIGRSPNCTITLKSIRVSRLQCEIIYNDGNILLRDTQSSNGTYVNNEKLTNETRKLEVGDLIGFGINPLPKRAYDQNQFVFSLQKYESEQSFEIADDDDVKSTSTAENMDHTYTLDPVDNLTLKPSDSEDFTAVCDFHFSDDEVEPESRNLQKNIDHKYEKPTRESLSRLFDDVKAPEPQYSNVKASESQNSGVKAPEPQYSNVKAPGAQISNVKAPEPQNSNVKAPEPQNSNVKAPGAQNSNVKAPEPQNSNVKAPEPQNSNVKAPEPQNSNVKTPEHQKTFKLASRTEKRTESLLDIRQRPSKLENTKSFSKSHQDLISMPVYVPDTINAQNYVVKTSNDANLVFQNQNTVMSCSNLGFVGQNTKYLQKSPRVEEIRRMSVGCQNMSNKDGNQKVGKLQAQNSGPITSNVAENLQKPESAQKITNFAPTSSNFNPISPATAPGSKNSSNEPIESATHSKYSKSYQKPTKSQQSLNPKSNPVDVFGTFESTPNTKSIQDYYNNLTDNEDEEVASNQTKKITTKSLEFFENLALVTKKIPLDQPSSSTTSPTKNQNYVTGSRISPQILSNNNQINEILGIEAKKRPMVIFDFKPKTATQCEGGQQQSTSKSLNASPMIQRKSSDDEKINKTIQSGKKLYEKIAMNQNLTPQVVTRRLSIFELIPTTSTNIVESPQKLQPKRLDFGTEPKRNEPKMLRNLLEGTSAVNKESQSEIQAQEDVKIVYKTYSSSKNRKTDRKGSKADGKSQKKQERTKDSKNVVGGKKTQPKHPKGAEFPTTARLPIQNPTTARFQPQNPTTSQIQTQNPTTAQSQPQNPTTARFQTQNSSTAHSQPQNPSPAQFQPQNPSTARIQTQNPTTAQPLPQNPTTARFQTQNPTTADSQLQNPPTAQPQPQIPTTAQSQPQNPTTAQPLPQNPTTANSQPQNPKIARIQPQTQKPSTSKSATQAEEHKMLKHVKHTSKPSRVRRTDAEIFRELELYTQKLNSSKAKEMEVASKGNLGKKPAESGVLAGQKSDGVSGQTVGQFTKPNPTSQKPQPVTHQIFSNSFKLSNLTTQKSSEPESNLNKRNCLSPTDVDEIKEILLKAVEEINEKIIKKKDQEVAQEIEREVVTKVLQIVDASDEDILDEKLGVFVKKDRKSKGSGNSKENVENSGSEAAGNRTSVIMKQNVSDVEVQRVSESSSVPAPNMMTNQPPRQVCVPTISTNPMIIASSLMPTTPIRIGATNVPSNNVLSTASAFPAVHTAPVPYQMVNSTAVLMDNANRSTCVISSDAKLSNLQFGVDRESMGDLGSADAQIEPRFGQNKSRLVKNSDFSQNITKNPNFDQTFPKNPKLAQGSLSQPQMMTNYPQTTQNVANIQRVTTKTSFSQIPPFIPQMLPTMSSATNPTQQSHNLHQNLPSLPQKPQSLPQNLPSLPQNSQNLPQKPQIQPQTLQYFISPTPTTTKTHPTATTIPSQRLKLKIQPNSSQISAIIDITEDSPEEVTIVNLEPTKRTTSISNLLEKSNKIFNVDAESLYNSNVDEIFYPQNFDDVGTENDGMLTGCLENDKLSENFEDCGGNRMKNVEDCDENRSKGLESGNEEVVVVVVDDDLEGGSRSEKNDERENDGKSDELRSNNCEKIGDFGTGREEMEPNKDKREIKHNNFEKLEDSSNNSKIKTSKIQKIDYNSSETTKNSSENTTNSLKTTQNSSNTTQNKSSEDPKPADTKASKSQIEEDSQAAQGEIVNKMSVNFDNKNCDKASSDCVRVACVEAEKDNQSFKVSENVICNEIMSDNENGEDVDSLNTSTDTEPKSPTPVVQILSKNALNTLMSKISTSSSITHQNPSNSLQSTKNQSTASKFITETDLDQLEVSSFESYNDLEEDVQNNFKIPLPITQQTSSRPSRSKIIKSNVNSRSSQRSALKPTVRRTKRQQKDSKEVIEKLKSKFEKIKHIMMKNEDTRDAKEVLDICEQFGAKNKSRKGSANYGVLVDLTEDVRDRSGSGDVEIVVVDEDNDLSDVREDKSDLKAENAEAQDTKAKTNQAERKEQKYEEQKIDKASKSTQIRASEACTSEKEDKKSSELQKVPKSNKNSEDPKYKVTKPEERSKVSRNSEDSKDKATNSGESLNQPQESSKPLQNGSNPAKMTQEKSKNSVEPSRRLLRSRSIAEDRTGPQFNDKSSVDKLTESIPSHNQSKTSETSTKPKESSEKAKNPENTPNKANQSEDELTTSKPIQTSTPKNTSTPKSNIRQLRSAGNKIEEISKKMDEKASEESTKPEKDDQNLLTSFLSISLDKLSVELLENRANVNSAKKLLSPVQDSSSPAKSSAKNPSTAQKNDEKSPNSKTFDKDTSKRYKGKDLLTLLGNSSKSVSKDGKEGLIETRRRESINKGKLQGDSESKDQKESLRIQEKVNKLAMPEEKSKESPMLEKPSKESSIPEENSKELSTPEKSTLKSQKAEKISKESSVPEKIDKNPKFSIKTRSSDSLNIKTATDRNFLPKTRSSDTLDTSESTTDASGTKTLPKTKSSDNLNINKPSDAADSSKFPKTRSSTSLSIDTPKTTRQMQKSKSSEHIEPLRSGEAKSEDPKNFNASNIDKTYSQDPQKLIKSISNSNSKQKEEKVDKLTEKDEKITEKIEKTQKIDNKTQKLDKSTENIDKIQATADKIPKINEKFIIENTVTVPLNDTVQSTSDERNTFKRILRNRSKSVDTSRGHLEVRRSSISRMFDKFDFMSTSESRLKGVERDGDDESARIDKNGSKIGSKSHDDDKLIKNDKTASKIEESKTSEHKTDTELRKIQQNVKNDEEDKPIRSLRNRLISMDSPHRTDNKKRLETSKVLLSESIHNKSQKRSQNISISSSKSKEQSSQIEDQSSGSEVQATKATNHDSKRSLRSRSFSQAEPLKSVKSNESDPKKSTDRNAQESITNEVEKLSESKEVTKTTKNQDNTTKKPQNTSSNHSKSIEKVQGSTSNQESKNSSSNQLKSSQMVQVSASNKDSSNPTITSAFSPHSSTSKPETTSKIEAVEEQAIRRNRGRPNKHLELNDSSLSSKQPIIQESMIRTKQRQENESKVAQESEKSQKSKESIKLSSNANNQDSDDDSTQNKKDEDSPEAKKQRLENAITNKLLTINLTSLRSRTKSTDQLKSTEPEKSSETSPQDPTKHSPPARRILIPTTSGNLELMKKLPLRIGNRMRRVENKPSQPVKSIREQLLESQRRSRSSEDPKVMDCKVMDPKAMDPKATSEREGKGNQKAGKSSEESSINEAGSSLKPSAESKLASQNNEAKNIQIEEPIRKDKHKVNKTDETKEFAAINQQKTTEPKEKINSNSCQKEIDNPTEDKDSKAQEDPKSAESSNLRATRHQTRACNKVAEAEPKNTQENVNKLEKEAGSSSKKIEDVFKPEKVEGASKNEKVKACSKSEKIVTISNPNKLEEGSKVKNIEASSKTEDIKAGSDPKNLEAGSKPQKIEASKSKNVKDSAQNDVNSKSEQSLTSRRASRYSKHSTEPQKEGFEDQNMTDKESRLRMASKSSKDPQKTLKDQKPSADPQKSSKETQKSTKDLKTSEKPQKSSKEAQKSTKEPQKSSKDQRSSADPQKSLKEPQKSSKDQKSSTDSQKSTANPQKPSKTPQKSSKAPQNTPHLKECFIHLHRLTPEEISKFTKRPKRRAISTRSTYSSMSSPERPLTRKSSISSDHIIDKILFDLKSSSSRRSSSDSNSDIVPLINLVNRSNLRSSRLPNNPLSSSVRTLLRQISDEKAGGDKKSTSGAKKRIFDVEKEADRSIVSESSDEDYTLQKYVDKVRNERLRSKNHDSSILDKDKESEQEESIKISTRSGRAVKLSEKLQKSPVGSKILLSSESCKLQRENSSETSSTEVSKEPKSNNLRMVEDQNKATDSTKEVDVQNDENSTKINKNQGKDSKDAKISLKTQKERKKDAEDTKMHPKIILDEPKLDVHSKNIEQESEYEDFSSIDSQADSQKPSKYQNTSANSEKLSKDPQKSSENEMESDESSEAIKIDSLETLSQNDTQDSEGLVDGSEDQDLVPEDKPSVPKDQNSRSEDQDLVPEGQDLVPENQDSDSEDSVPKDQDLVPEDQDSDSEDSVPEDKDLVPEDSVKKDHPSVPENKTINEQQTINSEPLKGQTKSPDEKNTKPKESSITANSSKESTLEPVNESSTSQKVPAQNYNLAFESKTSGFEIISFAHEVCDPDDGFGEKAHNLHKNNLAMEQEVIVKDAKDEPRVEPKEIQKSAVKVLKDNSKDELKEVLENRVESPKIDSTAESKEIQENRVKYTKSDSTGESKEVSEKRFKSSKHDSGVEPNEVLDRRPKDQKDSKKPKNQNSTEESIKSILRSITTQNATIAASNLESEELTTNTQESPQSDAKIDEQNEDLMISSSKLHENAKNFQAEPNQIQINPSTQHQCKKLDEAPDEVLNDKTASLKSQSKEVPAIDTNIIEIIDIVDEDKHEDSSKKLMVEKPQNLSSNSLKKFTITKPRRSSLRLEQRSSRLSDKLKKSKEFEELDLKSSKYDKRDTLSEGSCTKGILSLRDFDLSQQQQKELNLEQKDQNIQKRQQNDQKHQNQVQKQQNQVQNEQNHEQIQQNEQRRQNQLQQDPNHHQTQQQPDMPPKKLKSDELQPHSSSTSNQTQKSELNLIKLDKRSSNTENLHNFRSKLRKLLIGKHRSYSESLGVNNTKNMPRITRKSSISIDPSCQDYNPPPNSSATPKSPTKHTNESSQLASSINFSLEPNTHADKIDCIETDAKTSVPTHVHSIFSSTDDIDEKWKKIRDLIEIEKKRLTKREIESATEVTIVEESKDKEEVPETTEANDSIENNKNDEIVNKYREKFAENNKVEILSVENVSISPRRIDDILSKFDQVGEKVNNLLTSEVKISKRNVENLTENSIELIIDESIDEGLESSSGRGVDRNQGLEVVSSSNADLTENNKLNRAQKQLQKTTESTKLKSTHTKDNILKDLEDNTDLSTKTSNFKDQTTFKQAELSVSEGLIVKLQTSTSQSHLEHFKCLDAKNSEGTLQNIEENTQRFKNLQNLEANTQQTSIKPQNIDENAQKSNNIQNPAALTQKLSIEPYIYRTTEILASVASESINLQNLDATIQKTTKESQNLTITSTNLQVLGVKSQEPSKESQNLIAATTNLSKSDHLLSKFQDSNITEEPQRTSELESLLRSSNAVLPKITSELPFAHPEPKNSLESSKPTKSDSQKSKKVIENWTAIKTGPSSLRITKTSIANFKESNDATKIKRRYSVHEPVTSKDNSDSKYSIKTRRSSAYQESLTSNEASTISNHNTDTMDQSYQKHRPQIFQRSILIDPLPRYDVAIKNQPKKPKTDLQSKVKRSYAEMMKNFTSGPTPPPPKMPKIDTQFKKKIIFSNGSEVGLDDGGNVKTIEILDDAEEMTTESLNLAHPDGDLDHLLTDKPQVLPSGSSTQVFNKNTGSYSQSRSDANTSQNIQHAEVISKLKAKTLQNQQLIQQPQSSKQIPHPNITHPNNPQPGNSVIIEYFSNQGRLVSQTITSQQPKPQTYRNHQPMHISSFSEKTKEFLLSQLKSKLNNIKASQKNHGQQPVAIKVELSKSEYDNLPDLDDYLLDHELNFILSYKFKKYQLIDCDEAIRRIERLYLKISGKSIKPLCAESLIQNEAFSKVELNEQLPSSLGFSNFGEVIKTIEQNAGISRQQQILPQQLEAALNQRTIHSAQNSPNQVPENSTIVEVIDVTDLIAPHEAHAINQQIILIPQIPQANLPQFLPIPATQNADGSQIYMQNPQFVVTVQNQEQNQEIAIEEPVVESNKPQRYTFIDHEDEVLIIENNPQQILTSDRFEAVQNQAEEPKITNNISEKPLSMPLLSHEGHSEPKSAEVFRSGSNNQKLKKLQLNPQMFSKNLQISNQSSIHRNTLESQQNLHTPTATTQNIHPEILNIPKGTRITQIPSTTTSSSPKIYLELRNSNHNKDLTTASKSKPQNPSAAPQTPNRVLHIRKYQETPFSSQRTEISEKLFEKLLKDQNPPKVDKLQSQEHPNEQRFVPGLKILEKRQNSDQIPSINPNTNTSYSKGLRVLSCERINQSYELSMKKDQSRNIGPYIHRISSDDQTASSLVTHQLTQHQRVTQQATITSNQPTTTTSTIPQQSLQPPDSQSCSQSFISITQNAPNKEKILNLASIITNQTEDATEEVIILDDSLEDDQDKGTTEEVTENQQAMPSKDAEARKMQDDIFAVQDLASFGTSMIPIPSMIPLKGIPVEETQIEGSIIRNVNLPIQAREINVQRSIPSLSLIPTERRISKERRIPTDDNLLDEIKTTKPKRIYRKNKDKSTEEVLALVKKKRGRPRKSKDQLAPSTFLRRFGKPMGQRIYKRRSKEVEKRSLESVDQKLEAGPHGFEGIDHKLGTADYRSRAADHGLDAEDHRSSKSTIETTDHRSRTKSTIEAADPKFGSLYQELGAVKATNNKSVAIYQESGTKDHTSDFTDHNLSNPQQTLSKLHPPITENVKNEAEVTIHTSLEEEPVLELSVESDLPEELDADIKSGSQGEIECSSIDISKEEIIDVAEGNDPAVVEEIETSIPNVAGGNGPAVYKEIEGLNLTEAEGNDPAVYEGTEISIPDEAEGNDPAVYEGTEISIPDEAEGNDPAVYQETEDPAEDLQLPRLLLIYLESNSKTNFERASVINNKVTTTLTTNTQYQASKPSQNDLPTAEPQFSYPPYPDASIEEEDTDTLSEPEDITPFYPKFPEAQVILERLTDEVIALAMSSIKRLESTSIYYNFASKHSDILDSKGISTQEAARIKKRSLSFDEEAPPPKRPQIATKSTFSSSAIKTLPNSTQNKDSEDFEDGNEDEAIKRHRLEPEFYYEDPDYAPTTSKSHQVVRPADLDKFCNRNSDDDDDDEDDDMDNYGSEAYGTRIPTVSKMSQRYHKNYLSTIRTNEVAEEAEQVCIELSDEEVEADEYSVSDDERIMKMPIVSEKNLLPKEKSILAKEGKNDGKKRKVSFYNSVNVRTFFADDE